MPVAELLAPAIALAKRGLAQDWYTTLKIASSASVLRLYDESARIYLPNGLPPVPPYQGEPGFFRARQARRRRSSGWPRPGCDDFYSGDIAAQPRRRHRQGRAAWSMRRISPPAGPSCAPHRPSTGAARISLHTAGGLTAAPTLEAVVEGMDCGAARPLMAPTPPGSRRCRA